jgi:hypothetical protein
MALEVMGMDNLVKECRKAIFWIVYWQTRSANVHCEIVQDKKDSIIQGGSQCAAA